MANVEMLERVLTHIRDHPEEHNQRYWGARTECGTTACFAGTTVILAGHNLVWSPVDDPHTDVLEDACYCDTGEFSDAEPVPHVAADLLGITWEESVSLFHKSQTFDEVEATVKDIINGQH